MPQNYHFREENETASPALIYYQDILLQNTKTAIQMAGSAKKLWPHVKSHKSRDFTQLQVDLGILRFKCATIAEAEMTATTDATHILLAYPLVGPNIERFLRLQIAYPDKTFYALGDNYEQLSKLNDVSLSLHIQTTCLLDINTGMNRTGVSFDQALFMYQKLRKLPGLSFCGLHCYDGNRHEKEAGERFAKVHDTILQVKDLQKSIEQEGFCCSTLVMGGSPTFPCYAEAMPDVFYSPGTVFLYDAGYQAQFPDLPYTPGASILTRVISHPKEGYFSLDAGYKAVSAEQDYPGIIYGLPHAKACFQSEEHWTFRMEKGYEAERPPIGTIFYLLPWHICPTSALYDHALVVADGQLKTRWPITARNRQLTF